MRRWLSLALMFVAGTVLAVDPFGVEFNQSLADASVLVHVRVTVPPGYHLYADQIAASLKDGGEFLHPSAGDHPVTLRDEYTGSDRASFTNSFSMTYTLPLPLPDGIPFAFSYQGCSEKECFFPVTKTYRVWSPGSSGQAPSSEGAASAPASQPPWSSTSDRGHVSARAGGYLNAADFLAFLDRAEGKQGPSFGSDVGLAGRIKAGFALFSDNPVKFLERYGVWWTVLLILVGGVLLNLTPCVLPMIPINLAILGIGSQNSTRWRGFWLGGAYGAGIAAVYGVLGLVVVFTGSQFGTLNSLPTFNFVMGVLFGVLSLAMFDVFAIDLTRFQSGSVAEPSRPRGGFVAALVMGGVAALLAGACVAPVVIAVLLLSGNLFAHGAAIGLAFPFILGMGMALPWPFAGAGLAFLPKPGAWMNRVKYGFGVFILLFAFYYLSLAYHGWTGQPAAPASRAGVVAITVNDSAQWAEILKASAGDGRPVFVDFWATWCKNCEAMELTTFRDPEVLKRLSNYHVVKFQVENLTDPLARLVTERFEVKGLPSYLVVSPLARP